ncbi:aminoglycoside phosphotransferase family protein [Oceanobacillus massiliensis]|uniref:aminoglycoside phosphotransferase family protein n=1 Tax=Oceanobacillus massiliensis TaxID=1465765 RepID=UPI0002892DF8|nr:aminoglycoside phosphotransferase family protein [Oceanobacillus massiliensis]
MNLGSPIAIGNTAKIYLHNEMIIKVFRDDLPLTEAQYEADKQKIAYSYGLQVPKVLDVTLIAGRQAIIMEYVPGKTIGDILSQNKDQTAYYMNLSIDVQQKIHQIIPDSLEPMREKIRRQIESVNCLDARHKTCLIQKMESITFETKLCHGDFHLFNLLLSNEKVTIIDWVDSSAGDIRADVYRTYLLYSQFSKALADLYVHVYCEKSGIAKDDIFQWAPIISGARLSETVSSENTKRLLGIINHYCSL